MEHPIGLNPGVLAELKKALVELFPTLSVLHGVIPNSPCYVSFGLCEEILKEKSKVYRERSGEFDKSLFVAFAIDWLSDWLHLNCKYVEESTSVQLSDILANEKREIFIQDLTNAFSHLPYEYAVVLELKKDLFAPINCAVDNWPLGSAIELLFSQEQLTGFPTTTGKEDLDRLYGPNLLLDFGMKRGWTDTKDHVVLYGTGYVSRSQPTHTTFELFNNLNGVLGALHCSGALKLNYKRNDVFPSAQKSRIYVKRDERWNYSGLVETPTWLTEIIDRSTINKKTLGDDLPNASKEFVRHLNLAGQIFSDFSNSARARTALGWLMSSMLNVDEITSFVQGIIAIEAIIGANENPSELGKSRPIAERAAYFIAKNISERNEILSNVQKMYALRNRIVHEGYTRLSFVEHSLASHLQVLAKVIFAKELQFIFESTKK